MVFAGKVSDRVCFLLFMYGRQAPPKGGAGRPREAQNSTAEGGQTQSGPQEQREAPGPSGSLSRAHFGLGTGCPGVGPASGWGGVGVGGGGEVTEGG